MKPDGIDQTLGVEHVHVGQTRSAYLTQRMVEQGQVSLQLTGRTVAAGCVVKGRRIIANHR